ncbi:MAG: hypothetical protein ABIT76_07830 [Chthoniobacterales bacterium]
MGNISTPDSLQALLDLGFTAAEASAIQLDAAWGVYLYRTLPQTYEKYTQAINGYCHGYLDAADNTPPPVLPSLPVAPATPAAVKSGIEARRAKWVQQAKASTSYDAAVQGVTLRIESTGHAFDAATYQADIFGASSDAPGTVTCKFRKAGGQIDAMSFRGPQIGHGGVDRVRAFSGHASDAAHSGEFQRPARGMGSARPGLCAGRPRRHPEPDHDPARARLEERKGAHWFQ